MLCTWWDQLCVMSYEWFKPIETSLELSMNTIDEIGPSVQEKTPFPLAVFTTRSPNTSTTAWWLNQQFFKMKTRDVYRLLINFETFKLLRNVSICLTLIFVYFFEQSKSFADVQCERKIGPDPRIQRRFNATSVKRLSMSPDSTFFLMNMSCIYCIISQEETLC